jgi:hypothetical protein
VVRNNDFGGRICDLDETRTKQRIPRHSFLPDSWHFIHCLVLVRRVTVVQITMPEHVSMSDFFFLKKPDPQEKIKDYSISCRTGKDLKSKIYRDGSSPYGALRKSHKSYVVKLERHLCVFE